MKCPNCGSEQVNDARFCGECGQDLTNQMQNEFVNTVNEGRRREKLYIAIIIIMAFIVGIAIAMIALTGKNSESSQGGIGATETTVEDTQSSTEAPAQEPIVVIVTQAPTYDVAVSTMYVVNCDEWISLRKAPDSSASRITTIPLGASVSFIETSSNGFYKISYNGNTGYALAQYLSNEPPRAGVNHPAPVVTMRVVNCDEWISLRETASTSSKALKTIPLGKSVEYISDVGNGFYKVRYNGVVGYALAQYLR